MALRQPPHHLLARLASGWCGPVVRLERRPANLQVESLRPVSSFELNPKAVGGGKELPPPTREQGLQESEPMVALRIGESLSLRPVVGPDRIIEERVQDSRVVGGGTRYQRLHLEDLEQALPIAVHVGSPLSSPERRGK